MSTTERLLPEGSPHLAPDFAERVLQQVDLAIARRRLGQRIAGIGTALVLVAVVPTWFYLSLPRNDSATRVAGVSSAIASLERSAVTNRDAQVTMTTYFLPQADQLASFFNQYSAATYGMSFVNDSSIDQDLYSEDETP